MTSMVITSTEAVFTALARSLGSVERLKEVTERQDFVVNSENSAGVTPLQAAIMNGCGSHVSVMLDVGANIDDWIITFCESRYPHKPDVAAILRSWRNRGAAGDALAEIGF